jgi:hypothetical protein
MFILAAACLAVMKAREQDDVASQKETEAFAALIGGERVMARVRKAFGGRVQGGFLRHSSPLVLRVRISHPTQTDQARVDALLGSRSWVDLIPARLSGRELERLKSRVADLLDRYGVGGWAMSWDIAEERLLVTAPRMPPALRDRINTLTAGRVKYARGTVVPVSKAS